MKAYLCAIFLSICCVSNAFSAEVMNRKLIITTQEWAPYHYRLPNGEVGGEATEVVKRVLDEMGIKYEITGSPVKSSDSKVLYAQCQ